MIGRGAIANPWLFDQIRRQRRGETVTETTGAELLDYIRRLYESVCSPHVKESAQVQKMKKYMNYIAAPPDPSGHFLHDIRRVTNKQAFFAVCERYLAGSSTNALKKTLIK
jgi:tRNA-dihydrouridine synthase